MATESHLGWVKNHVEKRKEENRKLMESWFDK
jgi:hypothetical protein